MTRILLLLSVLLSFNHASAQLANGSIAPDFTGTDIYGVEHNLYDLLAEGKSVILDFSATWCGPCWSYKSAGTLNAYMKEFGPEGTEESMVFFIEADIATTLEDLQGNTAETVGDWVTGTNHPIIDDASIANRYQIQSYPTIMIVCPDRKLTSIGQEAASAIHGRSTSCPAVTGAPEVSFRADSYVGCGDLEVQFIDNSWPRPSTYLWDFGDGNTSTEESPVHTYTQEGEFDVKLSASTMDGEAEYTEENLISVGNGFPKVRHSVGPLSKDIGGGRYFEGGHQGLIIDAAESLIIESCTVFSDKAADRTVVVTDAMGNLVDLVTVFVGEGEQRIDLGLYVPAGVEYRLGLWSDAYLFRNDGGVNYPYLVDNLMQIRTSTAGTTPLNYYYYFYDIDVREAGCQGVSSSEDLLESAVNIYPNPTTGSLIIDAADAELKEIQVIDILGSVLNVNKETNGKNITLDLTKLNSGFYFVSIKDKLHKVFKQ